MLLFAAVSLGLIGAAGWVLGLYYDSPGDARGVWITAVVAWVVQLLTFAIARMSAKTNVIAGWGIGAVMRMLAIGVYALVIVKALDMPAAAPFFLFVFFFVTMVVEPLFLSI